MSANRLNVCDAIKCPFANVNPKPPRSSGCTRYSVSNHCHLLTPLEYGFDYQKSLQPNQYWLYADSEIDLKKIEQHNNNYIAQDESSQIRLEMESYTE